ncbi:MAG: PorV/PorQ family protein [Candidatus Marinimicrobia bacterium]|nr:PorV/PorQ family protein [Candidatus Neomarinimicrobiota bacterium]MCF7850951.1 PorV/PorQ family protein [Candidatus Neomarinimicrobiota bacterium]
MRKATILLLVILVATAFGQYRGGTTAAPFLKIGIGSRAIGMGEAFVALSDDASGLYWNPAGISRSDGPELFFSRNQWIADIDLNFAGVILPLYGIGTVGVSITSVNMEDMDVRTELEQDGTGEKFSSSMMAMQGSIARNLTDRFSIGFNVKYIQEQIWHMKASAVAIDMGTLFVTQFNDMRLGMNISNYGTSMTMAGRDALVRVDPDPNAEGNNDQIPAHYDMSTWDLPLLFRVGVAMDVLEMGVSKLTVAVDALHPNDNYESINVGAELNVLDRFFLRGGWKSPYIEPDAGLNRDAIEARQEGITMGAGFDLPLFGTGTGIKFDYAYADFGILNSVQRFSLNIYF